MNLIDEATEAARNCRDYSKKTALVRLTDELRDIYGQFCVSCSRADMVELVQIWTRVLLALGELPSNEKLTDAS